MNDPLVRVRVPDNVMFPVIDTPLTLLMVRLFRLATLDGIVMPDDDPPKAREDEDVVVRFVGVPDIAGPFNVRVYAPTFKAPLVRVRPYVMATEEERETPEALFIIIPPEPLKVAGSSVPVA